MQVFLLKVLGGGYSRHGDARRPTVYEGYLKNLKLQAPLLKGIEFKVCDYKEYENEKGCVFYLDPPYKDTTNYKNTIDYDEFYNFCRKISKNNFVFISEFNMPDDFFCIWKKEHNIIQNSYRDKGIIKIEKLYIHKELLCKMM